MAINLKGMSRKELIKLRDDVAKALKSAEDRERRNALKAAEKAVAEFGFSLNELSGDNGAGKKKKKATKKKAKSAPRFRDPNNAENTWSGRGGKPQWFHDAMSRGTDISTLEI